MVAGELCEGQLGGKVRHSAAHCQLDRCMRSLRRGGGRGVRERRRNEVRVRDYGPELPHTLKRLAVWWKREVS